MGLFVRYCYSFAAILLVSLFAGECSAQSTVPSVYQDLYTQLNTDINDFQSAIAASWNGSKYPVKFSAQLTDANSNTGPSLLQASSFTLIQNEIAYLKSIGVQAISVEVSFPMLDQPFFASIGHPEYQSSFVTFYANVASAIRSQGLQVIVESQSLIPTGLQSNWGTGLQQFYKTLNFQAYQAARAQTVGLVASTMKPDYFVLQEEPDTESVQSGLAEVGTIAGSTQMLNGSIAAARSAGVAGMKIGAGFGSWLQAFQLFANSFTQQQCNQTVIGPAGPIVQPCITSPLDFLDLHLFPITEGTKFCSSPPNPQACSSPNFWKNELAVVNTAMTAKVPMTISQSWLRKVRDSEWLQIDGDIQEAREAYSFWAPLDQAFLKTVSDLANYARMTFVVPFNTQNLAAYLNWSGGSSNCTMPACTALQGEGGGNTPAQVFSAVQSAGLNAVASSTVSNTGAFFAGLIQPFAVFLATASQVEPFAPNSIVSAYGANLTNVTATATPPLSTDLDGTTVTVTDSAGMSRAAYLFYVSPAQINYEVPDGSAAGQATVTIKAPNGSMQSANIQIGTVSPGVFQLNSSGLAAALVLRVISGVQQPLEQVYQLNASNSVVPLPIDLGTSANQIYLEIYGTGIRNAKNVAATVGGINVPVLFAGAAPVYAGLDQVNIGPLPRALAGQGSVNIVLTANGLAANTVNVSIK